MARGNSKTLTETGIRRLSKAKPGKRREIFDAVQPGLALRITDKGVKSWSVYYRINQGPNQRLTLGRWPDLGVAEARKQAGGAKDRAAKGEDPRRARMATGTRTFGELAEKYIELECPRLARSQEIESRIRRLLLDEWRYRPIDTLRKRDAIALTDRLREEKPAAAYTLYETIKRLFNWFEERDEFDTDVNPMTGLKPPVSKDPRKRTLSKPEIKRVWNAAAVVEYPFGPLIQILLLTGARRTEVSEATWAEVNIDGALWTIPEGRTKSDRAHLVPLSDMAVDILRQIKNTPRFDAGDFIFSTTRGRVAVSGFSKAKIRLDKACGINEPWRIHDLRRTVRTGLAELGVPEIVAEAVIGHQVKGLAAVYNQFEYSDEKRSALDRWAAHLRTIIDPPPENVVKIRETEVA